MKKLLFLITSTLFLFFFLLATPCAAKQINILVHPFENTGDKEYSWISAGITDTVITDLTSIRDISVVSNQDRKKVLEELKLTQSGLVEEDKIIKIGKLTGAQVIFTGSYLVSGNRIRVHARLVNVETGKVENSTKIDGTLDGIFDLQDKVVFTLMVDTEKITIADIKPVKLTEQDRKKIEEKPKPKLTAYEWYAKGLEVQDTNPKEALINFKKALDIDPNYTEALIAAGFTAGNTLNLFGEAFSYFTKAEGIFKDSNEAETAGYADLMMNIGIVYDGKGLPERALEYYLNSQGIRDRLGLQNTMEYAKLICNTGTAYANRGQLDIALGYYLNSQDIQNRLGLQNSIDYAALVNNIGNVYLKKGQLDPALEYLMKAQSIQDKLGLHDSALYAVVMMNIGNIYSKKGQLDRALEYHLNSKFIRDRLGQQNTSDYASFINNIGTVYAVKGEFNRALEYFLSAKSIFDGLGLQNTPEYADFTMNIGIVYDNKGQLDRALEYYLTSQSTWDRLDIQNIAGYAALMNNIGIVYDTKGQLDRALEYYRLSKSFRDRLDLQNTVEYAGLMYNFALLYQKQGKRDIAGRYFRIAYDTFVKSDYSGKERDEALNNAKRLGY